MLSGGSGVTGLSVAVLTWGPLGQLDGGWRPSDGFSCMLVAVTSSGAGSQYAYSGLSIWVGLPHSMVAEF